MLSAAPAYETVVALDKNAAATTDIQASTVSYDPKNFEAYNPITVMDILRRIPNARPVLSNLNHRGGRGFGSGGAPVLIDGKRISGKSNGVSSSLGRILVSQVERIELIRGTSSGLDVRSDGLVINIVLKEGGEKSHTSWEIENEYTQGVGMNQEGSVTHSGSKGALEYNVELEKKSYNMVEKKDNDLFDPEGLLYENEKSEKTDNAKFTSVSSNLKYSLSNGDILHLNGLYNKGHSTIDEDRVFDDIDPLGVATFNKTIEQDIFVKRSDWEIGGDYVGDLDAVGQLKVLFIISANHNKVDKDRTEITELDSELISQEFNDILKREKILRASITKSLGSKHDIEYGVEGAINNLDKGFTFEDPQDSEGTVEESTLVSEKRVEGFGSHSYDISSDLTLQSSMNGEYSNIVQAGPAGKSRAFFFLKPRFDLRVELGERDQLRAVVQRTVSQLNFENFAIRYNANDDEFEKGNPNLVPEKAWRNSLTYEHRLPDDGGTIEVKAFYNMIEDHIDKIAIAPDTQATGNVDDAQQYGMNLKSSFRLAALGLPDAILSADATVRGSSVVDPFTGENRPMKWYGSRFWRLNFQHDVSKANMSYGMELKKDGSGQRIEIDDRLSATHPVRMNAFMEVLTFGDMKLRLDARNLLQSRRHISRTLYAGNVADDTILWQKEQDRTLSRKLMLSLRGMF